MLIHAGASIPVIDESLVVALREFTEFVQQNLCARSGSDVCLTIFEPGARANLALALKLPDDTEEFFPAWLPAAAPVTAARFRQAVAVGKPKKTRSSINVNASIVPDLSGLLNAIAETIPPSGRGIMIMVHLRGWSIAGESHDILMDATFSRFRHGARDISAGVGLRFQVLSLKDPAVKETIARASARMKLKFAEPLASFCGTEQEVAIGQVPQAADPRLQRPTPEAQLIVLQTFDEAMARAAEQCGARREDLASIPLLFGRSDGFDKRMKDVMAGKKENVNLPSRLKRFMKDELTLYRFDMGDPEQLWFRKPVAPTLDFLLMFDKVHQWRLGKTFTIHFALDFPNTAFGAMYSGSGGARKNIFWMFHESWETQVWAYTTSAELEQALKGCAGLLHRIVPAMEEQCQKLLLPIPTAVPAGIVQLGALSAREAYRIALPMAQEWAADATLEDLVLRTVGEPVVGRGWALTSEGRLAAGGSWGFKFVSKRLDRYCWYTVPHTGRIWWDYYPVPQAVIPKYSAVLEFDDWADSTLVAPRALEALEREKDQSRVWAISLALRDPKRYSGNFVWEAHGILFGESRSERRDIISPCSWTLAREKLWAKRSDSEVAGCSGQSRLRK